MKSNSTGEAYVYLANGDSPYSLYNYSLSTDATPNFLSFSVATWGWLCSGSCTGADMPAPPWASVGTRAVGVNFLGNMIEAYAPGGQAQIGLWAEEVSEGTTLVKTVDSNGQPHYHPVGNNQWRRERLSDSQYTLTPQTPGTQAIPSIAASDGNGSYSAQMILGPTPQLNTVGAAEFTTSWTCLICPTVHSKLTPPSSPTTASTRQPCSG